MEQNIQTFFKKMFPSLKLSMKFNEELLSPGILFSFFYTKQKIEQWKNLKQKAFVLTEDEFKGFLKKYVEEEQELDVSSVQQSIGNEVSLEERLSLLEVKWKIKSAEAEIKKAETILLEENKKQEMVRIDLMAYNKKTMDGRVVLPFNFSLEEIVK